MCLHVLGPSLRGVAAIFLYSGCRPRSDISTRRENRLSLSLIGSSCIIRDFKSGGVSISRRIRSSLDSQGRFGWRRSRWIT